MPSTTSLSFPAMFDISRNCVAILGDSASIVNRTRLLVLTEPTEVYNTPNQGVGLKRHLWKYNTENERAIIRDRIVAQLGLHEPSVTADKTSFSDGLLHSESSGNSLQDLEMTIGLSTIYGQEIEVTIDNG